MFGRGGGLDPRKMQQMMQQMGVEFEELDATEVIIRLEGGEELYFDDADVTMIEAQGQETYQVVGEPTTRDGDGGGEAEATTEDGADDGADDVRDSDVELVARRAGVTEETAREALEAAGGDLAAAIDRLE